jgi:hypothetical protein
LRLLKTSTPQPIANFALLIVPSFLKISWSKFERK